MEYTRYLQEILKATGWSQEILANRLDVSFVTLNSWVNNRSVPRKKAQAAIQGLFFDTVGVDAVNPKMLVAQKLAASKLKLRRDDIVSDKGMLDALILYLTYHTNTIEGSTMTLADTEDVLFGRKVLSNRTQIEQAEARNHQAAILWLLDEIRGKDFVITEEFIRGLHLRLMNSILSDARQYRRHGVRIMRTRVTTANYLKIPELMQDLVLHIDDNSRDPITKLAYLHAKFEKIHPFSDGNGRVGRLLMLAQALRLGIVPPIVLNEKRRAYYKYLEVAQTTEDHAPLELFLANSVIDAKRLLWRDS
jgi:Fic family protein